MVSILLKKRAEHTKLSKSYHNLPLAMIGATFIWAGWYSFNAGSAYAANADAILALANTHFAACAGSLVWLGLEYCEQRSSSPASDVACKQGNDYNLRRVTSTVE